ncbi:MAG: glycosyltransferase family 4 protein [Aquificae bacterium]|nr:glycosyltransferase family 4 protein [Aquificota bacterium]
MARLKVLHAVEAFGGGVFTFIKLLTQGLSQFEHAVLYAPRPETPPSFERSFPGTVRFIRWRSAQREINPIKDAKALLELLTLLRRERFDVIHLHSSKAGFLGRLAARLLGLERRVAYTPHGPAFLRLDVSPRKRRFYALLERLAYQMGGRVVACSKSEARALCKEGIKATYVFTGLPCPREPVFKKPGSPFTVITVGRIAAQKNPALFNAVARRLEGEGVRFVWVGDGELKSLLRAKNVTVTGWLSEEAVERELKKADLYLSTSLWEGFPLAVLKAMCAGKPLLLRRCVGNEDAVKAGENGFLFERAEEAVSLIKLFKSSPDLLERAARNAYNLLRCRFSYERMLSEYARLYERLARS